MTGTARAHTGSARGEGGQEVAHILRTGAVVDTIAELLAVRLERWRASERTLGGACVVFVAVVERMAFSAFGGWVLKHLPLLRAAYALAERGDVLGDFQERLELLADDAAGRHDEAASAGLDAAAHLARALILGASRERRGAFETGDGRLRRAWNALFRLAAWSNVAPGQAACTIWAALDDVHEPSRAHAGDAEIVQALASLCEANGLGMPSGQAVALLGHDERAATFRAMRNMTRETAGFRDENGEEV